MNKAGVEYDREKYMDEKLEFINKILKLAQSESK